MCDGSENELMRIDSTAVWSLLLCSALAPDCACQSDWPKYRGARGDGVAAPQAVSRVWGENGPPELWRREFGTGLSSVAAVGDRLYTMGAPGDVEEAFCLDAKTGETIWRVPLGPRFEDKFGDGPRATPTVDGDLVFAVSSTMHLAAIGAVDGKVRWEKPSPIHSRSALGTGRQGPKRPTVARLGSWLGRSRPSLLASTIRSDRSGRGSAGNPRWSWNHPVAASRQTELGKEAAGSRRAASILGVRAGSR